MIVRLTLTLSFRPSVKQGQGVRLSLSLFVILFFSLVSPSLAATYTVSPDRDAGIIEDKPNDNLNGSELEIKGDGVKRRVPLLHFTLPAIPSNEVITSAILRLYVRKDDTNAGSIQRVNATWGETTVTWNTIFSSIDTTSITTITPNPNSVYVTATLTDLVRSWRNGSVANHGIAILPSVGMDAKFGSRERGSASERPELVITTALAPVFSLSKTSSVFSDPVRGMSNPLAIPGALVEYVVSLSNSSSGAADANTTIVTEQVPANLKLYVDNIGGSGSGPVSFVNGTPSSGLTYSYISLASTTDSLSFSNNNGASYTYIPSPDAQGFDTNVTHFRVNPTGSFAGNSGSGNPSFTIRLRMGIK